MLNFIVNSILFLLLSEAFFLCSVAATTGKTLWSTSITDETYYYSLISVESSIFYAGTLGLVQGCHVDGYDIFSGKLIKNISDVCVVSNKDTDISGFGSIGYEFPDLTIFYTDSKYQWKDQIVGRQYYPAYYESIVTRDDFVYIWGMEPTKGGSDEIACVYTLTTLTGTLTRGPCLQDIGTGQGADIISVSGDGKVVLLTAGFKAEIYDFNKDTLEFTIRYNISAGYSTVASLSHDGNNFAIGTAQGIAYYSYNGSTYMETIVIPPLDQTSLTIEGLVFSKESPNPLLVAYYTWDDGEYYQWAVAAYDTKSNGKKLWEFDSIRAASKYTDTIDSISVTDNGELVVVGSWGSELNINPQVHVFEGWNGTSAPVYTLSTAGSVMAVSAAKVRGTTSRFAIGVSSLAHHENVSIKGGYATLILIDLD